MNLASIVVEVVFALSFDQRSVRLQLPAGACVADAVARSGLLERYPGIDLKNNRLGIYGKLVVPQTVLRDGDRIEIYRPLIADPKQVRRECAKGRAKK